MNHLEGESLADRLSRGPLSPQQVLRVGAEIASALDAAHRQGLVHGGVHPRGILLTKAGAKLNFEAAGNAIPVESALPYRAPEQLENRPADARTDIWSLGAVMYEMATGRRAFVGRTKGSLIAAIVSSQPAPIASMTPMNPASLEHVIRKCLEKDPEERWQSAHDVAVELRWIGEAGAQVRVRTEKIPILPTRTILLVVLALLGWSLAAALGLWMWRQRVRTATPPAAVSSLSIAQTPVTCTRSPFSAALPDTASTAPSVRSL